MPRSAGAGDRDADAEMAIAAALDRLHGGGALGLAVSGGGDSVALAHVAADWAAARGMDLHIAVVDHGLRAESAAEADFVLTLAERLGARGDVLVWEDEDRAAAGNLAMRARDARLGLLADWARALDLGAVALGHTRDDQAETVLLRLARGSGVDGLAAMADCVTREGVRFIRPLLDLGRAELRAALTGRGARWVEDPSNDDLAYDRVKARRALEALEALGLGADGLVATAARMARARAALDTVSAALTAEAIAFGAFGEARVAAEPLRATPDELALRVVADALRGVSGAVYRPRAETTADILARLREDRLGGGRSAHGCLIRPAPGGALILREPAAVREETRAGRWDGRWRVGAPEGAEVRALGAAGLVALDLAEKSGRWSPPRAWSAAPRDVRIATPGIWRGGRLAAAPLAGYGEPVSVRHDPPAPDLAAGAVMR